MVFAFIIIGMFRSAAQPSDDMQLANEYYINGDYQKAALLYEDLAKQTRNIPTIHNNYFNVLLSLNDFKTAEKYLKRVLKYFPSNVYYQIDEGLLREAMGEIDVAEKIYRTIIDDIRGNDFLVRTAAQYMISKQLTQYALEAYLAGRKGNRDNSSYALEIANAYRILGRKEEMIDEYLKFGALRKSNLRYVKNILQTLLQDQDDIQDFKNVLIDNIQKHPNEPMYGDLLIWVNIQQNDFYSAFVQARALDKRYKENGERIMEIGDIALKNGAYDEAVEMYEYMVENYPMGRDYIEARRKIIETRESKIKNQFPVDPLAIRQLTRDYQQLLNELGINSQTAEAYRNKAMLHAFYLQENDTAIQILDEIIHTPRISRSIQAQSKLDLGDIYLLIGEPWESTLLYSQVEKANKSSKIGYEAKLKNAKLHYYKSNFELAKSHLDILKLATTREIANDAIALSLLINDNTALDSSDFVMKEYASIDLLLFQNKNDSALIRYKQMLQKYPGHSLTDEIHWQLASIYIALGQFENALAELEDIRRIYAEDIWGDDAMFLMAEIHEKHLGDESAAMEIYKEFLTTYPGSVFVAEARKRFRILRGDHVF